MKWNVDRTIEKLEPSMALTVPGTRFERVIMDTSLMKQYGVKPTPAQVKRGHGILWSMSLGVMGCPKAFFYGQTIRELCLKASRDARKGVLQPCLIGLTPKSRRREKGKGYARPTRTKPRTTER